MESRVELERYQFVEVPDAPPGHPKAIQLLDPQYAGFVYEYNDGIKMEEVSDDTGEGNLVVNFTYNIVDWGALYDEDTKVAEFQLLIGNILMDILEEQLEKNPENLIYTSTE